MNGKALASISLNTEKYNFNYLIFLIVSFIAISAVDYIDFFELNNSILIQFASLLKIIFLSFSFIFIALKWEDLAKNNIYLVPLIISCTIFLTSVFWSISPFLTVQSVIIHLLLWVFAISTCLNVNLNTLSYALGLFALFSLVISIIAISLGFKASDIFTYLQIIIGVLLLQKSKNLNIICGLMLIVLLIYGLVYQNNIAINIVLAFFIVFAIITIQKLINSISLNQIISGLIIIIYSAIIISYAIKNNAENVNIFINSNLDNGVTGIGFGLSEGVILNEFISGLGFLGLFFGLFIFAFILLKYILFKANRIDYLLLPLFTQIFINPSNFKINSAIFLIFIIIGYFTFKNIQNYDFKDSAAKIAR